jgi:Ran GTPase-activating protein (RanGAP) involved in mRNA processing and transport
MEPAFESRIYVSIRYPKLDVTSLKQIWTQFIGDSSLCQVSENKLEELAKLELNGWRIKNILRTAHLLSQEENSTGIGFEDIKAVLDLQSI